MNASVAIAIRIIRQLSGERRTIGMILVIPLIITFVFGYAFQGETFNNPIIVVNLDEGNPIFTLGDNINDKLNNDNRVEIVENSTNIDDAEQKVLDRSVDAVIFLPADLTDSLNQSSGLEVSITILIDEAEPAIAGSILAAVSDALNEVIEELDINFPITVKKNLAWGNTELEGLDVALPGIMGYIIMFIVILLTVLVLVREDLEGTKARFYAAPVNRWQIMLGYVLGMTFFAILISLTVMAVSIFVFGAVIRGSILLTLGFTLFFALGTLMLALFLARLANNEFQAVQSAIVVAIPSIALSGFLVPVNTLPDVLKIISNILPLTYAIEGLKTIMLRGGGLEDIIFEVSALTVYAIITFLGAVLVSKETVA